MPRNDDALAATVTPAEPPKPASSDTGRAAVGALEDTARSSDPTLGCPSDDVLAAHVAGKLGAGERDRMREHLDGCAGCRAIVVHAMRALGGWRDQPVTPATELADAPPPSPAPARAAPHRVGRFTILEQLGAGGMGVVYAAYDPQLDRKVAVKLVRTDLSDHRPAATRTAMLREAKAMAKVEHPNVITVYEVGEHDDQVFVAMELVSGSDLRAWMTTARRSWREVLDVCIQAGRGLAAAHRANLVHRDFKPDNVLVGGDGRVRVTDFGLARPALEPSAPAFEVDTPAASAAISDRLTRTGALVGTPAYMSPEQHRAEPADARSDQFAFCVTLWEALVRERPFAGTTYAELAINVSEGNLREPPRTDVPPRIRAALRRGMAVAPRDRFPAMDALLAALTYRRGRRVALAAGAAALVAATVGTTWAITSSGAATADPSTCPEPGQKLAGVWDAKRRAGVVGSLTAAAPFGAHVAERTARQLDSYTAAWSAAWVETCTARGELSDTLFDARVGCLSRRLRTLDTFTGALAASDAALASKAGALVDGLEPIAPCTDPALLTRVPPPPPAMRPAVDEIDALIDRSQALRIAGDYPACRAALARAVALADQLAYRPRIATTQLALGMVDIDTGDFAGAERALQRASSEALASNEDALAAQALITLVEVVGYHLGRAPEAHRLGDLARAAIERAGDPPKLRAGLWNAMSKVLLLEGKHADALATLDEVIALAPKIDDDGDVLLAEALSAKGIALFDLGRFAEARALLQRELELRAKTESTEHPLYASALVNRANLHFVANEWDAGVADLREARRIIIAAFGADTTEIVGIENNLGVVAGELGDWTEALRAARSAYAISQRSAGPRHPDTAKARANIGSALRELGKLAEAEPEMQAALALREDVLGPKHVDVGTGLFELGELRLLQQRPRDAVPLFQRARSIYLEALGDKHPQLAYATSGLGRAQLALGELGAARATLAATVELLVETDVDPVLLAKTLLALADTTWRLGDHPAAIAIAGKAEPALGKLPANTNPKLHAAIAAWRTFHQ